MLYMLKNNPGRYALIKHTEMLQQVVKKEMSSWNGYTNPTENEQKNKTKEPNWEQ